jgi:Tfp pilus assembly protein PilN
MRQMSDGGLGNLRNMIASAKTMIGYQQIGELSRADFLTSVGLYLTDERLVMVRLRKSFLAVSVLEHEERGLPARDSGQAISELTGWIAEDVREIALRAESDSRERALRQAIVSLLPHMNLARDQVFVCVPQDQTIVQQVFLPLAAEENLQQVLDYEIERQLPFKREEVYYDFLPAGRKGEKLCVYIFAIPKRNIDGLVTLFESLGIKPSGVETTVTALANYMLFTGQISGGAAALVAGHPGSWEMIGVEAKAGNWKPAAELLFTHRFPKSEWAHGAGKELLLEYSRQVPSLFRCGDLAALNGLAAERLATAEDLGAFESPRLKGFSTGDADAVPAIGAALRGVREASLRSNFLRHENGDSEANRLLSRLNRALLSVFVIVLTVWGLSFPIKDELRLRQLQAENRKLDPDVQALRREEEQLERLLKEKNFLSNLEQRRGEVLRVLDELSKAVPTNAYLSNLRYRAGVLEVQGNAENASALIPLLERSAVFENVGFNAPSNRGRDNRETFSLKADIEKPKASAKPVVKEPAKEPVKAAPAAPAVQDPRAKP